MLLRSITLPVAGASAYAPRTTSLDVAALNGGFFVYVEPPALTTGQLPDGESITYTLIESNDPALGSPISSTAMGAQTGAGGVGAAKVLLSARPKFVGGQFFGVQATASAGAAATGVSVPQQVAAG